MTGRLAGKTALITAAGQGIGKETARLFVQSGARVIASDIDENALAQLVSEEPKIETRALDVTDPVAVQKAAIELGAVDVLFNCAGHVANGSILDCEEDDWSFSFDLNVTSMYRMVRAFLPKMVESGGGSILNMSSVASSVTGVPNRFAYGATKAAVIGMTKAIAADFVKDAVRCNAICPGTILTPSLEGRINANDNPAAAKAAFIERQPMGRLGRPQEVAALAVYLASDEASFTTGAIHIVDGGWTI